MGWFMNLLGIGEKVQPVSINDENFRREVLESDLPVLLDVWTPTCVHCHKLEPIIMSLANQYKGRLKVAEVNGAEATRTMSALKVRGTPTIVYFYKGREIERVVGFRGSLYHQELIEGELLPLAEDPEGEAVARAS
jgi:thioredoxin 1